MFIKNAISLLLFKKKWRKNNKHNSTEPRVVFNPSLVTVGKMTYGSIYVLNFSNDYKISIGSYCSIGPGTVFVPCADHYYKHLSTFPFKVKVMGEQYEAIGKGDIIINDDVWIGINSTILSGVTIGQGAIVAAGSVVTKNVPPYAIVGGNPAKLIKYRFSEPIVKKLLSFDFSKLKDDDIKNKINMLYKDITEDNVDELLKEIGE